jgi:PAS domain S-box-containing protein/putative nucleotidyltransferase with HDIG domain
MLAIRANDHVVYPSQNMRMQSTADQLQPKTDYQTLFERLPVGMFRTTASGKIVEANRAVCRMLGYPTQRALRSVNAANIYVDPDERTGLVARLEQSGFVEAHEVQLRRHDNSQIWVRLTTRAVFGTGGQVKYFEGALEDITDQKLALSALRESEHFTETIISSVSEGVVVYDREYRYRVWNHFMERLTGMSAEYMLGKVAFDLFPHLHAEGIDILLYRAMAGEIVRAPETEFEVPGTSIKGWVQSVYSPHRTRTGEVMGVVATIHDISIQKQSEAELARLLASEREQRHQAERLGRASKALTLDLHRANDQLEATYDSTLEGWARALELRDRDTEGHSQRVANLTLVLAQRLGFPADDLVHLRRGALLHDIGKMAMPDEILSKNGPLSPQEWAVMRRHPQLGYDLLVRIEHLAPALEIPLAHHERWDGSGYPHRLAGIAIPLAARIFMVVDVWDALTNDRPYRKAWTPEQSLDFIRRQAGVLFDSQIVAQFMQLDLGQ